MRWSARCPARRLGNSLAESWTESPDGLVYEFRLRRGIRFHNGEPITTDDVKFSFERYRGAGATELQARVRQVEIVDPAVVRFHLREPWPDFMTFYGTTATAAGLIVPRTYVTQVGDEGFRKHPIGAGPYRFVSQPPASRSSWRPTPGVGSPIAVARSATAAGRQLRARSPGHQRGLVPGFCPPTSVIVPRVMDFALQTPGLPHDAARARQLLAEAGTPTASTPATSCRSRPSSRRPRRR